MQTEQKSTSLTAYLDRAIPNKTEIMHFFTDSHTPKSWISIIHILVEVYDSSGDGFH